MNTAWCVPLLAAAALAPFAVSTARSDAPTTVTPAAYARLVEENQSLRRRLEQATADQTAAATEQAALQRRITDLDQRLSILTFQLAAARENATAETARMAALRQALKNLDSTRSRLESEVRRLRESEQRLQAQQAAARADPDERAVEPRSDLFQELQRETLRIQEQNVRLQAEIDRAEMQRDATLDLLEQTLPRLRTQADMIERLQQRARDEAQRDTQAWQQRIAERDERIQSLRAENRRLQEPRRDRDAAAASRPPQERHAPPPAQPDAPASAPAAPPAATHSADRPARAAAAPLPEADRRQRNLHYNLGVHFTRAGRPEEARREYLAALALDPEDADTHYNLGLLFETDLDNRASAIHHYRRYLEIRPASPLAASVRQALLRLEMRERLPRRP